MPSLFKLNQLSSKGELPLIWDESGGVLDHKDREIYALRQQLQALKTLYKHAKVQAESLQKKPIESASEISYSKQRVEKLMAALAEREKQMRSMQQEAKDLQAQAIQAKQIAVDEIAALHGQVEFLKTKLINSQALLKAQQQQIQTLLEEQANGIIGLSQMEYQE